MAVKSSLDMGRKFHGWFFYETSWKLVTANLLETSTKLQWNYFDIVLSCQTSKVQNTIYAEKIWTWFSSRSLLRLFQARVTVTQFINKPDKLRYHWVRSKYPPPPPPSLLKSLALNQGGGIHSIRTEIDYNSWVFERREISLGKSVLNQGGGRI